MDRVRKLRILLIVIGFIVFIISFSKVEAYFNPFSIYSPRYYGSMFTNPFASVSYWGYPGLYNLSPLLITNIPFSLPSPLLSASPIVLGRSSFGLTPPTTTLAPIGITVAPTVVPTTAIFFPLI